MPHREKSHAWRSSLENQRQNKTHPSPPVHKLNAQNSVRRKVGSVSRLFYFAFYRWYTNRGSVCCMLSFVQAEGGHHKYPGFNAFFVYIEVIGMNRRIFPIGKPAH